MDENTTYAKGLIEEKQDTSREKILIRYFIPPNTFELMKWGQAFMVFILLSLIHI